MAAKQNEVLLPSETNVIRYGAPVPAESPAPLVIEGHVAQTVECADRDGPLAPLLDAAGPRTGADHATVHGTDGDYCVCLPLADLRAATIEAGRLTLAASAPQAWAVRDVARIEITVGPRADNAGSCASEKG